jgi:uncharacterized protein (TIGR02246 family)
MTAANPSNSSLDQEQIRAVVESCAQAIRRKDVEAVLAHFAPELVAFDMMPPFRQDARAYKQTYAQWFSMIDGPIDYQISDLQVAAGGDVGFCAMTSRVRYTTRTGEKQDGSVRVTIGLRKINNKWLAVHEHVSVPFDMTTGKAIMDAAA